MRTHNQFLVASIFYSLPINKSISHFLTFDKIVYILISKTNEPYYLKNFSEQKISIKQNIGKHGTASKMIKCESLGLKSSKCFFKKIPYRDLGCITKI